MGEVRVLGSVELVDAGEPVPLPGKQRRLLAALVVAAGRPSTVDELAEALWDGSPPQSARKLVQVYVSQLRKALPADLEIATAPGGYALELPPGALDATRFDELVSASARARRAGSPALAASLVEQALALWRGRAYGELADEELARSEAGRLEELRLLALEERNDAQLALGRHAEVLGEVLRAAREHPYRERFQGQAMVALYRSGRQSDALEHYAATRARLREELGLEPGPDLRALQRRVLEQDSSLDVGETASGGARELPLPPNALVGRERELAELRQLLEGREARLLVLTGAGGSGKTRLALEAARAAAGAYANGAAFVELAPLRDAALVAPAIARALRIAEVPGEAPANTLERALAAEELLLVVDNAEHVRESAPLLTRLVAGASRLTILVTSRAVLHVSGERVFPVAPLEEDAAHDLFVARATLLSPQFEPSAEDDEHVREICRRVDCLPLAIELAAARIRTLAPAALRERLDARLSVLTGGPRDLPARQQTLRETIAWSVDLLDDRQRTAFARLAVFPGGATLGAAEAVCECDLDTLAVLVDDHLVLRDDAHGEPRFVLLETIREFALDVLGDERGHVERELGLHFAGFVDRADLSAGVEEWLPRLDAEVDNLRAALAAGAGTEAELRIAAGLWRYWLIRGFLVEGLDHIEGALGRGPRAPTHERGWALVGGAKLALSLGDFARARELGERGIRMARRTGSPWVESMGHIVLGTTAADELDFATARRHLERSIGIVEAQGEEPVIEKLNLGFVALESGDVAGALALFEGVLAYHRLHGYVEGIGFAVHARGLALLELEDVDGARRDFEEALECFQALGFRAPIAHALQGLAAIEVADGRYAEAARLLGRAAADLSEAAWLADTNQIDLATKVEQAARRALGDDAFEAAFAGTA